MTTDPRERREVWSRYWATGMPHSCGTTYESTYGGTIGTFWRDAFSGLAPGDRVLDIATGNAALPRLLLSSRPQLLAECDAVDIAEVAPDWLLQLEPQQRQRFRVHGGVRAESLPFPDGVFSLVISQYGIEYADGSLAIPEALRVLSPRGRIRILAHHAASRPVVFAGHEIAHIDWLLRNDGLVDLAAGMIEPMALAATAQGRARLASDAAANQLRQRFNAVQTALTARLASAQCPDVLHEVRDGVAQVFRLAATAGVAAGLPALDQVRRGLADSRLRLEDLRLHALDEAGVRRLCEAFDRRSLHTTAVPLSDEGHLLGWAVCSDPRA